MKIGRNEAKDHVVALAEIDLVESGGKRLGPYCHGWNFRRAERIEQEQIPLLDFRIQNRICAGTTRLVAEKNLRRLLERERKRPALARMDANTSQPFELRGQI